MPEAKTTDDLVEELPDWMPKAPYTGNYKLLNVAGLALDDLNSDIDHLENATTVQYAESIGQLEQLAELIDLPPKDGESKEKYRTRIIANYQINTAEGTAPELIEAVAALLDIPPEKVRYKENPGTENGVIEVHVPNSALSESQLTDNEFAKIIEDQAAAGYRIFGQVLGTLTYLGTSDYLGTDPFDPADLDSDPTKGYDGLDSNGNPKDNGGTYAGIIGS
jgi:hypothetical protein